MLKRVDRRFWAFATNGSTNSQNSKQVDLRFLRAWNKLVDRRFLRGCDSAVVCLSWLWFGCDMAVVRLCFMQLFSAVIRLQWGYDSAAVRAWSKWIGYFSEVLSRVSCGCDRAVMQLWFECDVAMIRVWSVLEISGSAISQRLWSGSDAAVMWLWFRLQYGCASAATQAWNKWIGDFSEVVIRLSCGCATAAVLMRLWFVCGVSVIRLWSEPETSGSAISQRLWSGFDIWL